MKELKRFLVMAKPFRRPIVITVLMLIGVSAISLVTPEMVRKMTGILTDGSATAEKMAMYAAVLLIAYIIKGVFSFFAKWQAHIAAWNFVGDLTLNVYSKLQTLSMGYFTDKQTGEMMSRIINDTRNLENLIAHCLPDLLSNILIILLVAVMIFNINPLLAVIALIPVPFLIFVSTKFSKKVLPKFKVNQQVLAELNSVVQDNISGIKEIQAFGKEKTEYLRMKDFCRHYSQVNISANFSAAIFHPSIEFLTSIGSVLVMGIGGTLALKGKLDVADVVGFFMYLSLFYSPLAVLARIVEDAQTAYAGGLRVLEVLDTEPEVKDSGNAVEIGRAEGNIEFKNVSFYYNEKEPVLNDVSFNVKAGQMIAFVGATGVGKSTIVSLLERFYDPIKGSVLLDGKDIKDISIKSLRENLSIV
ncbi:MAG: ABC transporter ATP-binding protein, partial [Acutalibacteraceae bacterium]|nr:ABC transporter ATP-binding protein [Acutalibacteraceae bacterium]